VNRRLAIAGGIAGPAAFVSAWAVLGAHTAGYSPVDDAISRLAAAGAPDRALMSAGMLAFAGGVSAYAVGARSLLGARAAIALGTTAVATAGVAAFPLDASYGDAPHALVAAIAYLALAAAPIAGARAPVLVGRRGAAPASRLAGALIAASLATSVLAPGAHGLFQRIGLTVGDAWIVGTALCALGRAAPRPDRDRAPN
jgi:hypothetical membrane protein